MLQTALVVLVIVALGCWQIVDGQTISSLYFVNNGQLLTSLANGSSISSILLEYTETGFGFDIYPQTINVTSFDVVYNTIYFNGQSVYSAPVRTIAPFAFFNSSGVLVNLLNHTGGGAYVFSSSVKYASNNATLFTISITSNYSPNQSCNPTCKTCTGPGANNCTSCTNSAQFISNGACVLCSYPCATCNTISTSCTSCTPPLVLQNNTCVAVCASNQYQISATSCGNCDGSCAQCSGPGPNACSLCTSPSLLLNSQCVGSCPAVGYYSNGVSCSACSSTCQQCSQSATNCISYSNSCGNGYYLGNNNTCLNCSAGCSSCSGPSACLSCSNSAYALYNGACYNGCPSGTQGVLGDYFTCEASGCINGELMEAWGLSDSSTDAQLNQNFHFAYSSSFATPQVSWSLSSPANYYFVHLTGAIYIPMDGKYTFTEQSDDGVSVWINGQMVIADSAIFKGQQTTPSGTYQNVTLTQGWNCILVDYYQATGSAVYQLYWAIQANNNAINIPQQPVPSSAYMTCVTSSPACGAIASPSYSLCAGTLQSGLTVSYVDSLGNVLSTKSNVTVDYAPGTANAAPVTGVSGVNFTAIWTGYISVYTGGMYQVAFTLGAGTATVIIGGATIFNQITATNITNFQLAMNFDPNALYTVRVIYSKVQGIGNAALLWQAMYRGSGFTSPFPNANVVIPINSLMSCSICSAGFSLDNGVCTPSCNLGSYLLNNSCVFACPSNYLIYNGACVQACPVNTFYYAKNASCFDTCPSQTFGNTTTGSCQACSSTCLTCSSQNVCTSCSNGAYVAAGGTCNGGCDSSCSTCSGPSPNQCTSCSNTTYFYQSRCYTTCPAGTIASFSVPNQPICTIPSCLPGYYGPNCAAACTCGQGQCNNSIYSTSAACTCSVGWAQSNSTAPQSPCNICSAGYYGSSCSPCLCQNGVCNGGLNGNGLCSSCNSGAYFGSLCTACSCVNGNCSQGLNGTGACSCSPGFSGSTCNVCAPNHGGPSCTSCPSCNNGVCSTGITGTGQCNCNNNFAGPDGITTTGVSMCNKCLSGSYGPNCTTCTCGYGSCNQGINGTGYCTCSSGYAQSQPQIATSPCNTCAAGYYNNSGSCVQCSYPCANCSSSSTCTSCSPPTVFINNTCLAVCSSNQYLSSPITCGSCSSTCQTCVGPSATNCTSCNATLGLHLQSNGACVSTCPSNTFLNTTTNMCQLCDPSCLTCSGSSINSCLTCNSTIPLHLNSATNACVSTCPSNNFLNTTTNTCLLCDSSCLTCSNSSIYSCLSCNATLGLHLQSNGACVSNCGSSSFVDSNDNCQSCDPSCLTCSGSSINSCLTCNSTIPLHLNSATNACVSTCPSNTFLNTTANMCQFCDSSCLTCSGSNATDCASCNANLGLHLQNNGACVSTCPSNTFLNTTTNMCQLCDPSCLTCSGSSINSCLTCNSTIPLHLNPATNACVSTCPSNTFLNTGTNTCLLCDSSCLTCSNSSIYSCLSCNATLGLHLQSNGACVSKCGPSTYVDSYDQCQSCDPSCLTCSGSSINSCLTCNSTIPLHLNSATNACVSTCPSNTFLDTTTNTCLLCDSSCLTCSGPSADSCLSCDATVPLHFNTGTTSCVSSCSSNNFVDATTNTCSRCDSSCATCTGPLPSQCTSCLTQPPSFIYNGTCYATCPVGTLPSDVTTPISCVPGCVPGYYGPSCTACNCGNGTCAQGLTGNGTCTCSTGYAQSSSVPQQPCDVCASGYGGDDCHYIVPCPSACVAPFQCDDYTGTCICSGHFTGPSCLSCLPGYTRPDLGCPVAVECPVPDCNNNGACNLLNGNCVCSSGWLGVNCDVPDPCAPNPCENGGSCSSIVNEAALEANYTCSCPSDYIGYDCQIQVIYPVIDIISPAVSPLVGGANITIIGNNFQDGIVLILSAPGIGQFFNYSPPAFSPVSSSKRDTADVQFTVMFPRFPIDSNEYATITLINPTGGFVSNSSFYYTSDCPYEGEWGVGLECAPCPSNAICPGGNRIYPKPGAWSPNNETAPTDCSPPASRCLGGPSSACAAGYTGSLCSNCDDEYYNLQGQCLPCGGNNLANTIALLLLDVIFLIVLIISIMSFRASIIKKIMLGIATLQILRTTLQLMESRLPSQLLTVIEIIAYGSGNISSFSQAQCLLGDPFEIQFWAQMCFLIIAILLIALLLPLKWLWVEFGWPPIHGWLVRWRIIHQSDVNVDDDLFGESDDYLGNFSRQVEVLSQSSKRQSQYSVDTAFDAKFKWRYRRAEVIDLPDNEFDPAIVRKGDLVTIYGKSTSKEGCFNVTIDRTGENCMLPFASLELSNLGSPTPSVRSRASTLRFLSLQRHTSLDVLAAELAGAQEAGQTQERGTWPALVAYMKARLLRALVIILLFEYTSTTIVVFQAIVCVDIYGQLVLQAYPTEVCFQGSHTPIFVIAVIVLAVYLVGLPGSLFIYLFRNRRKLSTDWRIGQSFGYIYESFRPSMYFAGVFWLVVLLFQGLSFSLSLLGAMVVSVIFFGLFGLFLAFFQPFNYYLVNLIGAIVMLFAVIVRVFIYFNVDASVFLATAVAFIIFSFIVAMLVILFPIILAVIERRRKQEESRQQALQLAQPVFLPNLFPLPATEVEESDQIDMEEFVVQREVSFMNPMYVRKRVEPREDEIKPTMFIEVPIWQPKTNKNNSPGEEDDDVMSPQPMSPYDVTTTFLKD